jgi:hypothetical protein
VLNKSLVGILRPWLPAHRLTAAQREQLAGYAELDQRVVRKKIGVAPDVISAAIAGEDLAPELVGRLTAFLDQQSAARGDARARA